MRSNHWNTILSGRQIGQKVNSLVANQLLRSPFDVHAEKLTSPTPTLRHATHTHTRPCPAHLKLLHNSCWWCCEHWYSSRKRGQLTREMPTSFHLFPQTIPIAASDLVVRSSLDAIFTSGFDPLTTRWLNLAQPNFDKTSNGLFEGWTFRAAVVG